VALIVQKYGGTSVADVAKVKAVAERVVRTVRDGNKVVVIVSAMSGETDKLIQLAHGISDRPSEREVDLLLSSGERVTSALTAIAIQALGHKARALTGRQAGIMTDTVHTRARIARISGDRITRTLDEGYIIVIAGFQGVTEDGTDVTTLGRGGSDLSAVAVAVAIQADRCEIYTDVEGIYTTDPNIVAEARKIDKISYEEMLELASLGAKVLQTRSVEFAMKNNMPIIVRSSFSDNPGTLVTEEDKDMEDVMVSGIAYDKKQARFTIVNVPDKPGIAAHLFNGVASADITVDMIVQNISGDGKFADISFTVPSSDAQRALDVARGMAEELGAQKVDVNEDISKVSIVGVGMRTHSGVASKMFQTLAYHNINIMMISTSEIKISCVIDAKFTELAVRVLHDAFDLSKR
jgi:aspartate kinase